MQRRLRGQRICSSSSANNFDATNANCLPKFSEIFPGLRRSYASLIRCRIERSRCALHSVTRMSPFEAFTMTCASGGGKKSLIQKSSSVFARVEIWASRSSAEVHLPSTATPQVSHFAKRAHSFFLTNSPSTLLKVRYSSHARAHTHHAWHQCSAFALHAARRKSRRAARCQTCTSRRFACSRLPRETAEC